MKIYISESFNGLNAEVISSRYNKIKTVHGNNAVIEFLRKKMSADSINFGLQNNKNIFYLTTKDFFVLKKGISDKNFDEVNSMFQNNLALNYNGDDINQEKIRDENKRLSAYLKKRKAKKIQAFKKIEVASLSEIILVNSVKFYIDKNTNEIKIDDTLTYSVSDNIEDNSFEEVKTDEHYEDVDDAFTYNPQTDGEISIDNFIIDNSLVEVETVKEALSAEEIETLAFGDIVVGSGYNEYVENKVDNFLATEAGQTLVNCCDTYGLDVDLVVSLAITESSLEHYENLPGGASFDGSAYGLMQVIYSHVGETITALNKTTNQYDSLYITEEVLSNPNSNVLCGVMMYSKYNDLYNGNVYFSTIAYNMGQGVSDLIIDKLAENYNLNEEETLVYCDYEKILTEVKLVNSNPQGYPQTCSSFVCLANCAACSCLEEQTCATHGDANKIEKLFLNYAGEALDLIQTSANYYANNLVEDYETEETTNYTFVR